MDKTTKRIEMLKSMDTIIWDFDDDDYIEQWVAYGVPDFTFATEHGYKDIAENDKRYFDICDLFATLIKHINRDVQHDKNRG